MIGGGIGGGWGGDATGYYDAYGYYVKRPCPDAFVPRQDQELINATFSKWDIKGDGFIRKNELTHVLLSLGIDKKKTADYFRDADWNNDGKIDQKEFIYWLYGSMKCPNRVKEKALVPTYKVLVNKLSVVVTRDPRAEVFVRWRDLFTNGIICESPVGPTGPESEINLHGKNSSPLIFDIPSDDKRAVCVEICQKGTFGTSVIAVTELQLGLIAREFALGLGQVREIRVDTFKEEKKPGQKPEKVGELTLSLSEATEGDKSWAKRKVKEWKENGLPQLPTFADSTGIVETLIIESDPQLERTTIERINALTNEVLKQFPTWTPDEASTELDGLADDLLRLKRTSDKARSFDGNDNFSRNFAKTREDVTTYVVTETLKGSSPNHKLMKAVLKFAFNVHKDNRNIYQLERLFKEMLKFPENARLEELMATPDADLLQCDPKKMGLNLASDELQPPDVDDHTRWHVRDETAQRVLGLIGCDEKIAYSQGYSYERMAPETIGDKNFRLGPQAFAVARSILAFRGEKQADKMNLAELMTVRQNARAGDEGPMALLGRFDVVAQPVIAEYDKNFQPLGKTPELPEGFFGADSKSTIGGRGWFWVLHAAAMNIGESARAEDFKEYSIDRSSEYTGTWANERSLDEHKYFQDMTSLWRRSLQAAVHLGLKEMVMFPFGMGAFLRNLDDCDGYYKDPMARRRIRKGIAAGLFSSLQELVQAGLKMKIHVCLVDSGIESRVNHNVFMESAQEKMQELPALGELVLFHRNVDALDLARKLASVDGPADQVRPVGMLNGANNKLLGNHWFAQGARRAIDENIHRRSTVMCLGSLLMNMATAPQHRSFQELANNVTLIGGTVVDLQPYPVACGESCFKGRLFSRLVLKPYGVLGLQSQGGKAVRNGPDPPKNCAIVDPVDLHTLQSGPAGGSRISAEIYKWLGIDRDAKFPNEVVSSLKEPLQAKLSDYKGKMCIHVVGPNLRDNKRGSTREQAVLELAHAYAFIFGEFCTCKNASVLRLLPLCGLSGPFVDHIPAMTGEALAAAFGMLPAKMQDRLLLSEAIDLCLYSDQELAAYNAAFRE